MRDLVKARHWVISKLSKSCFESSRARFTALLNESCEMPPPLRNLTEVAFCRTCALFAFLDAHSLEDLKINFRELLQSTS